MDASKQCRTEREAWMLAFDADRDPEQASAHLARCAGCREFARACEEARLQLRSLPTAAADPAADAAILAALRSETSPRRILADTLRDAVASLLRPASLRLAGAGAASFLATLLAAGLLSDDSPDGAPGAGLARSEPPAARQAAASEGEFDAWLRSSRPTLFPPARPLPQPPAPPEPDPARRSRRPAPRRTA